MDNLDTSAKTTVGNFFFRLLRFKIKRIYNCQNQLYLTRVKLLETRWFNIYWHRFNRSDEDRALHDHPWPFISIPIWPGYWEWIPEFKIIGIFPRGVKYLASGKRRKFRLPFWPLFRPADWAHRVDVLLVPTYSLVIVGRKQREWGYHENAGWINNRQWWNKEKCDENF